MIGVDQALDQVARAARGAGTLGVETVPLSEAAGRVLRQEVAADRDMPPFTRSAMDGYAVRAADTARAPVRLEVVEAIPAGTGPSRAVGPGQASRIMTGAPLPEGADAVQMVEKTSSASPGEVTVLEPVVAGDHVRLKGEDLRQGEVLLRSGAFLGPAAIALLASAGRSTVAVSRRARVAIVPTGDELVPVEAEPGPAQIRESNGHALAALVSESGGEPLRHAALPDSLPELTEGLRRALAGADLLLVSGGVSMGDYDLVGEALRGAGCSSLFTRVAIQPGKPLYFGNTGAPAPRLVFGLPGNPVSTVVDFLVFVRPALRLLSGAAGWRDETFPARLAAPIDRRPGRRAYLPAVRRVEGEALQVELLASRGSADMVSLCRADCLVIIPEDASRLEAGAAVRALPLVWPGRSATAPPPGAR
ncbi:MAG TPA: gephyrin-like molybdotransferase Glp [Candidatus Polarisedimenticolia bacterium]|nr:gephyrin-like molybdotransferase Glp [Candidatus Polarisedimenticolia bacterium]